MRLRKLGIYSQLPSYCNIWGGGPGRMRQRKPRTPDYTARLLDLVGRHGLIRPRDLAEHGIPRTYLKRLVERGQLVREGRGLYLGADADITEHHTLAEAAVRAPRGVICLLSALRFHRLTTQNPVEVWMAVDRKAWRPRPGYPPLRLAFLSGDAFTQGIETHRVSGVPVRVYSAAKTVADCFKFRRKIGLDVALEALADYRRRHRSGMDELWRFALTCRVARVMRPYLEATA